MGIQSKQAALRRELTDELLKLYPEGIWQSSFYLANAKGIVNCDSTNISAMNGRTIALFLDVARRAYNAESSK